MSSAKTSTSSPDAPEPKAPAPAAPNTGKPKKKGRLRRWIVRLAVLAIVLRMALAFSLERLVEYGVTFAGLEGTCESAELSFSGCSVRLQRISLIDPEGGEQALRVRADELSADVSTWQLLTGDLVLVNALVSGLQIDVHRDANGAPILPASWTATAATPPEPEPDETDTEPPSFELPCRVDTARIHDLRLNLYEADATGEPFGLVLDLSAVELGVREREGRIELRLASDGVTDRVVLGARMTSSASRLDVTWELNVRGLDLARIMPRLFAGTAPLHLAADGSLRVTREQDGPTNVAVRAQLPQSPGLADDLELTADCAFAADGAMTAECELKATALTLAALRPLLERSGIRIQEGGIDAALQAKLETHPSGAMDLELARATLGTGDDRVSLGPIAVRGLLTKDGSTEVEEVIVEEIAAHARREADGSLAFAGIRLVPVAAAGATETTGPGEEPAPTPSTGTPRIRLGRLDCRATKLSFTDRVAAEPITFALESLKIEGNELAFAGGSASGDLAVALRPVDVAERVRIDVAMRPTAGGTSVEADFACEGTTLTALEPLLVPVGIRPTLTSGHLAFRTTFDLVGAAVPERLAAELSDLRFEDDGEVLLGLASARLVGLCLKGEGPLFEEVRVEQPFVLVERNGETTEVCGLAFGRPPASDVEAPEPSGVATAPATPATTPTTGPIHLDDATIVLLDGDDPARSLRLEVRGEVGAIARGATVPFDLTVQAAERIDDLALRGEFLLDDERSELDCSLIGRGIHGSALDAFLPPHITSTLENGCLTGEIRAVTTSRDDGTSLELDIDDLGLLEGDRSLARIRRLHLSAPLLAAERIHIAAAKVEGLRASVIATTDGLRVPGFRIAAAPPATPTAKPEKRDPAAPAAPPPPPSGGGPLPAIQLDEFVVSADELVWHDRRDPASEPVNAVFALTLAEPWRTADDLEESKPLKLALTAEAKPVLESLALDVVARPFTSAPEFDLNLSASGLDPTAIGRVAPALADTIGGTDDDLTVKAKLHAELALRREDVTRFDLSRPFGATLVVEDLTVTNSEGEDLLSIPDVEVEARAIDPGTGDLLLRRVDIDSPRLAARKTAEGLAVAGFLLKAPPAREPGKAVAQKPRPRTLPANEVRSPEFGVDQLRVFGLGFDWRDETTATPTHLPIDELDVELRRFSTRALTEPRQFAFKVSVRGGAVELEQRIVYSSFLTGMLGSTANLVSGAADKHRLEQRPLLDELLVEGNLQLFPRPLGRVETSLRGLELQALRGLAKEGAVDIGDGMLDANIEADLGRAGNDIKSLLTFRHLQISEPPGGPISTYLRLPAALDTVLFALRNDDGEQRIPLRFQMPPNEFSTSRITAAAIEALSKLIGNAIASAPLRILRTVTDVAGVTGGEEDLQAKAMALEWTAGSAEPDREGLAALREFLDGVAGDETIELVVGHEFGAADEEHASALANPEPAVVRRAVERLRKRRDVLERERSDLAAEVSARYHAGQLHGARAGLEELRMIDDRLGRTQASLDATARRIDGDKERHRKRRTREALVELGQRRLDAVEVLLTQRLGVSDRIVIRSPRPAVTEGLEQGGRVVVIPRRRGQ